MKTTSTPSVIVIGAGIGGIAAAAHLAQQGLRVRVIEKNARPGGRCDRFDREGHHFDAGPTLFVMPLVYEAEFAALGVDMHEVLDLQRVDPTYHLIFDDGNRLELTSDLKRMRDQLECIETGSFLGLLRYLEEGHRHYHLAMDKLVNRDFRTAGEFFALDNVPLLFQLKPLSKHYDNIGNYFTHPRLKAAFTFQDVYMGLSPFEAPATFSMMPYTELAHGVWYPKGGMYQVVEALMAIAQAAGVEFEFGTTVEQIVVKGSAGHRVESRRESLSGSRCYYRQCRFALRLPVSSASG
ncbi:MAG: phytoene desaturase family protein [Candidatus Promineifilaceae bacterium]